MTAINPEELKKKAAEISELFFQPQAYIAAIHDFFSTYGDRVHRPGQSGAPPPAMDSYHIPTPMFHPLVTGVKDFITEDPEAALDLIDALWDEDWMETKRLAILFLGEIPHEHVDAVVKRVKKWTQGSQEDPLLKGIFDQGLSSLRDADKGRYLSLVEELNDASGEHAPRILLHGLQPLIEEGQYQNYPLLFQTVKPLLQEEDESYLPALKKIIRSFAQASEQETIYFLQHQIPTSPHPKIDRLLRGVLDAFSPASQAMIKGALREG